MKKIIVAFLVSIISFSAFTPAVLAARSMRGGERVVLEKNEVIDDNYFAAGESVIVSGTVNGDAYVAGSSVIVDGVINGDLLVAGSDLDIKGTVNGDIRAAGANVTISGQVGGNLTVGAGKVLVTDGAFLAGSIVAGAGDLNIAAPIGKGITAGVGKFYLADTVGGDINYWSEEDLTLGGDATVSGTMTRHDVPKSERRNEREVARAFAGMAVGFKVIEMVGLLLVGMILLKVIPVYAESAVKEMNTKPWTSMLIGFIAVVMIPIAILILLMTVIGIPLAGIGILAYILLLVFAKIFAGLFLGTKIMGYFSKSPNAYIALIVGFVLFAVLAMIPVVGWIVMIGIYFIALGGLVLHRKSFYDSLRTKKLI